MIDPVQTEFVLTYLRGLSSDEQGDCALGDAMYIYQTHFDGSPELANVDQIHVEKVIEQWMDDYDRAH